jgi:protein-S-isoprenylcysteine O-methyltransferase Ste14
MRRAILESAAFLLVLAASLFAARGSLAWPPGWGVFAVYALFTAAGLVLLPADLLAERSRLPSDAQPRDLLIAGFAFVFLMPATLIVCGFDARWHWSTPVPAGLQWAALTVFALGYAVSLWAAWSNPFFSAVVRVQRERGHHVVASGPYALVRHPGYAGPMVAHLALPFALGAPWGLVPALIGCGCVLLRLRYEERVLAAELSGYRDYARRVPWRLLPHVW